MHKETEHITELVLKAAARARAESAEAEDETRISGPLRWPLDCQIGPGLEGAIACESKVGFVNGSKGRLIYRGYDVFDLCAYATFEEVCYLLLHGELPTEDQLRAFKANLVSHRHIQATKRRLMGFPVEEMNAMAALRLGTLLMRQEFTFLDKDFGRPDIASAIGSDEDSIPMETKPYGERRAIYEFRGRWRRRTSLRSPSRDAVGLESCYRLIAGVSSLAAAIARIRQGHLPIEPDPKLGHAANFLYMLTGEKPSPIETRIMDIALILHADHGMNASTFAAMVVASTLSDFYFAVGSGIAALNGPLHGGANEQVIHTLHEIGSPRKTKAWCKRAIAKKARIMGFGHRVYKVYDPRARVLQPLAALASKSHREGARLFRIARALEKDVHATIGRKKKIYPNVDYFSGIVYASLGISPDVFTPIFAVSRVAGWTARVYEYLQHNRIFRPRAMYVGEFDRPYVPLKRRKK